MLRKLRIKITVVTVLSMTAVFLIIVSAMFAGVRINFNENTGDILMYIAENGGTLPVSPNGEVSDVINNDYISGFGFGLKITAETPYETRYFTVRVDDSGEVVYVDVSHIAEISAEKAGNCAKMVLMRGRENGMFHQYRYLCRDIGDGLRELTFLNCTSELRWFYAIMYLTGSIMVFALVVASTLVWIASKWIVSNLSVNLENQKKFITNASHEIKTPIAIIDANAEVLKYTAGENEWIDSIQNQTKRLSHLTKRLVALSKAEENTFSENIERFSLSDAISDTAHSLKASAERRGISYSIDVEHGVYMKGDEGAIRQLAEVLIENAVKYCTESGEIVIRLYTKSRSIYFETYNDCEGIDTSKLTKLFDRFYRADDSRARETGGFGIGLSIAKAVVTAHKGKIYANCENDHSITFVTVF